MLIAYRVNGITNDIERLRCTNQDHLMQMLDRWGFQCVLHYASDAGMQCAVYCHTVSNNDVAVRDMCLAVTNPNRDGTAVRVQDITRFVKERYHLDAHPPIRTSMSDIQSTPNAGTQRTGRDLGRWCDLCINALQRYHVIVNVLGRKRKTQTHPDA